MNNFLNTSKNNDINPSEIEYKNFKSLLEYFIAHLEWMENQDEKGRGYGKYIKPLIDEGSFKMQGKGYKGDNIQLQVAEWDTFNNGKLCINIVHHPTMRYKSKSSYLNWQYTGLMISAVWDGKFINRLVLHDYKWGTDQTWEDLDYSKSIGELGPFDDETPNENLKDFFDKFNRLVIQYKRKSNMNIIQPYIDLLEANKNIILTGAPGTGKTYLAKEIAKQMIGVTTDDELEESGQFDFVQFHPSYDYTDFVEGLRPTSPDENGNIGFRRIDGIFKKFCKRAEKATIIDEVDNFDEVWDNLIESIKDNLSKNKLTKIGKWDYGISKNDTLKYSSLNTPSKYTFTITKQNIYNIYQNKPARRSLAFQKDMKDIVQYMQDNLNLKPYQQGTLSPSNDTLKFIFVIDEINRGEISKIFGELFFSMDPGYRGKSGSIKTQYANLIDEDDIFYEGFHIPENVYIIGTMNDIDRSVESMDFAMRRRFAWKEIKATDRTAMWDGNIDEWKDDAEKRMNSLNQAIEELEGLSLAYHIGPAYFLKLKNYKGNFEMLWENHLKGILSEYLRGYPDSEEKLRKLEEAYKISEGTDESNDGQ